MKNAIKSLNIKATDSEIKSLMIELDTDGYTTYIQKNFRSLDLYSIKSKKIQ